MALLILGKALTLENLNATNMVGGCRLASQIHKEVCFILVDPISY